MSTEESEGYHAREQIPVRIAASTGLVWGNAFARPLLSHRIRSVQGNTLAPAIRLGFTSTREFREHSPSGRNLPGVRR